MTHIEPRAKPSGSRTGRRHRTGSHTVRPTPDSAQNFPAFERSSITVNSLATSVSLQNAQSRGVLEPSKPTCDLNHCSDCVMSVNIATGAWVACAANRTSRSKRASGAEPTSPDRLTAPNRARFVPRPGECGNLALPMPGGRHQVFDDGHARRRHRAAFRAGRAAAPKRQDDGRPPLSPMTVVWLKRLSLPSAATSPLRSPSSASSTTTSMGGVKASQSLTVWTSSATFSSSPDPGMPTTRHWTARPSPANITA